MGTEFDCLSCIEGLSLQYDDNKTICYNLSLILDDPILIDETIQEINIESNTT